MTNLEDKEDVMKEVQKNGLALEFASEELQADPEKLADELYARGYLDRQNGKDYDSRGAAEWQVAVNAMKKAAT